EKPETLEEETARALFGYRTAMTYIIRVHDDPHAEVNAQFIRSLHFMMLSYDMTMLPGQWRPGAIYVIRSPSNERVYEGPDAEQVPSLVDELVAQINSADDIDSSTVLAAMAHLNLAMIHPFKDGNGRMARALQAMVLARNGVVSPTFCSIEEWLGRNTEAYYNILAEVGQGRWSPQRDALPWVRFCLVAHYQQAATLIKRNAIIGRAWNEVARLRKQYGLLDRMELVLMDAIFGYRVRNQRHREHNELSEVVASRDLKRLTELGLLEAVGEKRGRYYVAAPPLKEIWKRSIDPTKAPNPYDILGVKNKSDFQLSLPV
ncbi:MAG: Fic family protein, partial [Hyphomicrobiales bacterium]|nr:Fic family protein [Hyphomicrobiales bacterium]